MEEIYYLTHVTSEVKKEKIQHDDILQAYVETNPKSLPIEDLPLRQPGAPAGVWFGASLYEGRLPDRSPYGNCRVKVPLDEIMNQLDAQPDQNPPLLFKEGEFYWKDVRYIRLIMCSSRHWWMNHVDLQQLDRDNNEYLTYAIRPEIDSASTWNMTSTLRSSVKQRETRVYNWNNNWGVCQRTHSNKTYVDVFVPTNINVTGCEWDCVEMWHA